jgi:hypothetical protein
MNNVQVHFELGWVIIVLVLILISFCVKWVVEWWNET